ncbi:TolC family protein [Zoogloea sp.]|uniref:TolC family protein n=1 Tax=Zoogloea sp. TaxID=49181 RepID=UPI0026399BF5|nr:TolC family protein [Zoogloea sp.]MDD3354493.1 TolC family protein [Zoogloea sp.]
MSVRLLLPLLALVLATASPAQAAGTAPLSFAAAEGLLLEANPDIQQARTALLAARAGTQMAGVSPNPVLSVGVSSINPARKGSGGYWDRPFDNLVRLDQQLERGDKRTHRLRAAGSNLSATQADLDNTIRLARLDLANTWLDLLAGGEVARIARENARLAARTAEAASLRGKAGDLAGVDVARFEADAARVANDARLAELAQTRARIALALLLGNQIPADQLETDGQWPEAPGPAAEPGERPDLLAARRRLEQADALREVARAQRTRDVSVGIQYEHYPPEGRNTFGVSISVPLLTGNDYRGDIARSEADYTAAGQQLSATQAAIQAERARLQSDHAARQERYQRLREVALPAAERAGRGAEAAIQKGGMSLTDYLDTQRTLRAARIETVQARADLARSAISLRLAGAAE